MNALKKPALHQAHRKALSVRVISVTLQAHPPRRLPRFSSQSHLRPRHFLLPQLQAVLASHSPQPSVFLFRNCPAEGTPKVVPPPWGQRSHWLVNMGLQRLGPTPRGIGGDFSCTPSQRTSPSAQSCFPPPFPPLHPQNKTTTQESPTHKSEPLIMFSGKQTYGRWV